MGEDGGAMGWRGGSGLSTLGRGCSTTGSICTCDVPTFVLAEAVFVGGVDACCVGFQHIAFAKEQPIGADVGEVFQYLLHDSKARIVPARHYVRNVGAFDAEDFREPLRRHPGIFHYFLKPFYHRFTILNS